MAGYQVQIKHGKVSSVVITQFLGMSGRVKAQLYATDETTVDSLLKQAHAIVEILKANETQKPALEPVFLD